LHKIHEEDDVVEEKDVKELLQDKKIHDQAMGLYRERLLPVRTLVEKIQFTGDDKIAPYDTEEEIAARRANSSNFYRHVSSALPEAQKEEDLEKTNNIQPQELRDLIKSIYQLDDPVWSALFLAGDNAPCLGADLDTHFVRYLFHPNPRIGNVRKHIAKIYARTGRGNAVSWRNLTMVILNALKDHNISRRFATEFDSPSQHALFNVSVDEAKRPRLQRRASTRFWRKLYPLNPDLLMDSPQV